MSHRSKPSPKTGCEYVSKGGMKLAFALEYFQVNPENWVVGDLGSHQGGFVDCLLKKGAHKVYSVDTCYGTLAWNLRKNPKVVVCERMNAIHWICPEKLDLITIDVGWTKQRHIIPAAIQNLKPDGKILSLLKPQYEWGFQKETKGVLLPDQVNSVLAEILSWMQERFAQVFSVFSPYLGSGGNTEIWLYLINPKVVRKI